MMTQLFATLAIAAASLAAQGQTWIVDAAAGAGSQFTDIPPALQVAQDGDTILVRSGTYNGGSITRGISIITPSEASVKVRVTSGSFFSPGFGFEVDGLPAGKSVVLEGLSPQMPSPSVATSFVRLANCAGRVHLDNLSGAGPTTGFAFQAIEITDCAHVSIHDSTLQEVGHVSATRSTVAISDSDLRGRDAFGGFASLTYAEVALITEDSQFTIARSQIRGGDGTSSGTFLPPAPGIKATNGTFTIAGGAEAVVSVGSGASMTAISAIEGTGAIIEIDPRVTVTSHSGPPGAPSSHTITVARVPSVSATAGGPGGALVIDLLATAGDLSDILISLPFGPIASPIPGSGNIWVNFAAMLHVGAAQVPANEQRRATVPIPPVASIEGVPLTIQALTASATTGFRFSTPATAVLN